MSQVIRIPENLYSRLEKHAKGFDTPAGVIEKILNYYEKNKIDPDDNEENVFYSEPNLNHKLEIVFHPTNENEFKQKLLQNKKAYILLHKLDGTTELREWQANRFSTSSDINANLRSGHLRGWKNRGIYKAEVAIDEASIT